MTMLTLGSHSLPHRLILAPMAGVSDRPFRALCRQYGADLAVSEMISANPALRQHHKTLKRLNLEGEPSPRSVQILGNDPQHMAEAARINADRGADIIDINMGCPAKKVCKKAAGSALLRDEVLVGTILEAVVNAVSVPVTLKIRTGWDLEHRNGPSIARIAEESGIRALAVHGRTRACNFSGQAEYLTIRAIKNTVHIPVIANGDIDTPEKASQVLASTGADGIMIGRAALGQPWLFRAMIARFHPEYALQRAPEHSEVLSTILNHLESLYAFYGEEQGIRLARKHVGWYTNYLKRPADFTARFNTLGTARDQLVAIGSLSQPDYVHLTA
ncbi:MAG: tRNA dihydrouridine synthase DusB [Methylococcaceae bacterium]